MAHKIDARLLAELGRLEPVMEVWLPGPEVHGERELARFRLRRVKHRTALKTRIHACSPRTACPARQAISSVSAAKMWTFSSRAAR